MTRRTFKTSDESEFGNKEIDLLEEGYQLSDDQHSLKPGQCWKTVETDLLEGELVFILEWVDMD